jgi:hypothetical protein
MKRGMHMGCCSQPPSNPLIHPNPLGLALLTSHLARPHTAIFPKPSVSAVLLGIVSRGPRSAPRMQPRPEFPVVIGMEPDPAALIVRHLSPLSTIFRSFVEPEIGFDLEPVPIFAALKIPVGSRHT